MPLSNFNIHGIPPEQGVGSSQKIKRTAHHELDNLAGTWSVQDAQIFEDNTKFFEKIDEEFAHETLC